MIQNDSGAEPSLLITGGWGYGNIGDEAILMSMLDRIVNRIPQADITVTSYSPKDTKRYHGIDAIESLHRLIHPLTILFIPRILAIALWLVIYKLLGPQLMIDKSLRSYIGYVKRCDVFVMGGGGYFNDLWKDGFLARILEIVIAKTLNKKIMIYGQTVGPFGSRFSRVFLGRILNQVDLITYRDAQSSATLSHFGFRTDRMIYTADEASLIESGDCNPEELLEVLGIPRPNLLVGVMVQHFRRYASNAGLTSKGRIETSAEYLALMEQLLVEVHRRHNAVIVFLPSTSWDLTVCEQLYRRLYEKVPGSVHLAKDTGVKDYVSLCQTMHLMISTNMHPVILAATNSVPAVALSYWYKVDDLMDAIGMGSFVWRIDDFRVEDVIRGIDEIVENRQFYSTTVAEGFQDVCRRARMNAKYLQKLTASVS